jgi:hypothetical protein
MGAADPLTPAHEKGRRGIPNRPASWNFFGAGNGIRTHDFNLGNVLEGPDTIRKTLKKQRATRPHEYARDPLGT